MAKKDKFQDLIDRQEGFNKVSISRLPDGGVEIMLFHRNTMDDAMVVRVPTELDVRDMNSLEDEAAVERTNTGGPWNA